MHNSDPQCVNFDNAMTHVKRAEGALSAHYMPKFMSKCEPTFTMKMESQFMELMRCWKKQRSA
jgi:hypothetical protein